MNRLEFRKLPQLSYPVNEAFNTLSTNVSFLGRDIKKIMLTSSHASEGKSFTSITLSRKLAERGKRVVLVDTDLRRSMITTVYGVQFAPGSKSRACLTIWPALPKRRKSCSTPTFRAWTLSLWATNC